MSCYHLNECLRCSGVVEELEAQIQDLIISEAKAIEMINKMKCCENCKNRHQPTFCVSCDDSWSEWELRI